MNRRFGNPLNPGLYNFLWDWFRGKVLVSKAGQPFRYVETAWRGEPAARPAPGRGGEEYLVDCPLCGDRRNRCSVNHRFGGLVGPNLPVVGAVHCYNERCRGLPDWFSDRLREYGLHPRVAVPAEAEEAFDPDRLAREAAASHERLTGFEFVDELPPGHPAVRYVRERGFDPGYLVDHFRVCHREREGRLIAPVFARGLEAGWVARAIPGHTRLTPGDPGRAWPWREGKYVNSPGLPKSRLLYNLDLASGHPVIGVAEGVTDVWRLGPWGVALLGKTMSETQCRLLCRAAEAGGAWIVLLGDADAADAWRANHYRLLGAYVHPERVRLYLFREGDPADRSSRELHEITKGVLHDSGDRDNQIG
jgi:hypothetical protein